MIIAYYLNRLLGDKDDTVNSETQPLGELQPVLGGVGAGVSD